MQSQPSPKGRGRSWGLVVLSVALLAFGVAGFVATVVAVTRLDLGEAVRAEAGSRAVADGAGVAPAELEVGDCLDYPADTEAFLTVPTRSCSTPHDAEVFHQFRMKQAAADYPTDEEFWDEVLATCLPQFERYVGIAYEHHADLDIDWFAPIEMGWRSGDRTVSCLAYRMDGQKLTSSVRRGV